MTAPNLPGLPLAEEWAKACHLKKSGREWIGPCPLCGGTDRFHVRDGSNGAGTVKLTDLAPNQRLGHSLSC